MARGGLGSTATAHGYARPHTEWKGLATFFGMFARLAKPIDFGGLDGRRVDLVFLPLSPPDAGRAHLAALAAVACRLRGAAIAAKLRGMRDAKKLHEILTAVPEIAAL
jgi:PTS system nitrogen regulatory IIA component